MRKFTTKVGKFGKIFTVNPKIRKNLLEILLKNLGKFVNFFDNFENDNFEKILKFRKFEKVLKIMNIWGNFFRKFR